MKIPPKIIFKIHTSTLKYMNPKNIPQMSRTPPKCSSFHTIQQDSITILNTAYGLFVCYPFPAIICFSCFVFALLLTSSKSPAPLPHSSVDTPHIFSPVSHFLVFVVFSSLVSVLGVLLSSWGGWFLCDAAFFIHQTEKVQFDLKTNRSLLCVCVR